MVSLALLYDEWESSITLAILDDRTCPDQLQMMYTMKNEELVKYHEKMGARVIEKKSGCVEKTCRILNTSVSIPIKKTTDHDIRYLGQMSF